MSIYYIYERVLYTLEQYRHYNNIEREYYRPDTHYNNIDTIPPAHISPAAT
jgi:hypothetical protein